jgi:hypothetical protein
MQSLDEGSICNCECMLYHNPHRGRRTGDQHSLQLLESKTSWCFVAFLVVVAAAVYAALQQEFQSAS